ncbi:MAG TPA: ABC transporter substrate-binding protein, partial [Roseiflexaceae bacterium]|nr:ABC transporter substrate-binding protein [Roseiflexaceae bacterium]
ADVTAEAPEQGVELVSTQNFEETDTDMTAQVQAARDAGAQAIFTYALAPALSNIFKSMDKVGFKVPVIGSWALSQPTLRQLAGEDLLKKYDVYMAQSYTIDQNEVAKALHEKTLTTFNEDPFPIAVGQTYDATRLMLMALDKAGPDSKKIRDAIEQIGDFQAATTAPAKPFAADDHEAIDAKDIFVGQLKDVGGKLQVVKAQ